MEDMTVEESDNSSELWTYHPEFFSNDLYETLYEELKTKAVAYTNTIFGKSYPSKRASCFFRTTGTELPEANASYFSYGDLDSYDWSESPTLDAIKRKVEETFDTHYDYCLVHIYRNGKDNISWHSDKEALNSDVLSVSFGAERRFLLREIGKTYEKGEVEAEYRLGSGDVFRMLEGCQRRYIHTVPSEASVKTARINLTFRKFDS